MRHRWVPRLKSVLLSVLLLGGLGGMSLVDALIYHSRGEAGRAPVRVASSDAPRSHAASCILGAAVPLAGLVVDGHAPVIARPVADQPRCVVPGQPRAAERVLAHSPRAPPQPSV